MSDTLTANIGLLVADPNDVVTYTTHIGNNLTKVDTFLGAVDCLSTTRPTTTYKGQIIFEEDSQRYAQNTGTSASPNWLYMSHQALSATSSSRPTSGLTAGELIYESDNTLVRPRGSGLWLPNVASCTSGARPANPVAGDLLTESNTHRLIQWTGSAWLQTAFSNFVATSSTHPGAPFQGLEIFESDTGLSAIYNGSNYLYGMQQLAPTQKLGSAANTVTFTSIPAVNNLLITWRTRTTSGNSNDNMFLQFNSDTGLHYGAELLDATGTTAAASSNAINSASGVLIGVITGGAGSAGYGSCGFAFIPGFSQAASGTQLDCVSTWFAAWGTGASNMFAGISGGAYNPSAAVTSLTLNPANGQLVAGSVFSLYGSN
jgi:hypothetical protein